MMHRELTRIELTMADIEEWNKEEEKAEKANKDMETTPTTSTSNTNNSNITREQQLIQRRKQIRVRIGYETPK